MMDYIYKRFPLLQMSKICKICYGRPVVHLRKSKCSFCKRSHSDYKKAGLEREVAQYEYLHNMWLKCKRFKQRTCGVNALDTIMVMLWGKPHTDGWQDPYREGGDHGYEARKAAGVAVT